MNGSAEYTRLLAQAYSKLADDYVAMMQRVIDAEARVKELEQDNAQLREWIREQGKHTDTCTYHILGREICTYCRCHRMPNATQGGAK